MNTILYEVGFQLETSYLLLIFLALAFPLTLILKWHEITVINRIILGIACAILLLVCVVGFKSQYDMYTTVMNAYRTGQYQIVDGYVENFQPLQSGGHGLESFEINGVQFFYSDHKVMPGYHAVKDHGGVITSNGQHLKIGYVYYNDLYGNIIVYIEELAEVSITS